METGLIIINGALLLLLTLWALKLRNKEQTLEEIRKRLSQIVDGLRAMEHLNVRVEYEYRFSDSDFNKTEAKMTRDARERLTGAIGRRVVKTVGLDEIVEAGALVGYRGDFVVRKSQPTNYDYGEDH